MECSVSRAHKTWSRSLLFFKRFSCVSASQDPGGHAISRQKIPRVAFALLYLLIELFYIDACGADGRAVDGRTALLLCSATFVQLWRLDLLFAILAPLSNFYLSEQYLSKI